MVARLYEAVLEDHLRAHRQMAFVSGPRQVGKTTSCQSAARNAAYLSWDDQDDRRLILRGPAAVAEAIGLERLRDEPRRVVFDEIHKYARWRTFLKGLFDKHSADLRIIVTGSSRLDVYRRGGDSLMGRYLRYRMHPLSVGELLRPTPGRREVAPPQPMDDRRFKRLLEHGGFPEPYLKASRAFSNRWKRLRLDQLVREDVRDLTRITEIDQLEVMVAILLATSGSVLSYSNLAKEVNVSVDTARRWVSTLTMLHQGFLVRPWFKNVRKSLRKEPKWYVRDWSMVQEPGHRLETFVACHLLKAVETWEDLGLGRYELRYLRDRNKREVDFAVIRDSEPWFLVEVKTSGTSLSPQLRHFQQQTGAVHAFQAQLDAPFVATSAFRRRTPTVVPLRTLLSQLP